jgi:hypothetical protein
MNDLDVRPSKIHGLGVFALRKFVRHETVEVAHVLVFDHPPPYTGPYVWHWKSNWALTMSPMAFANHSDKPSCSSRRYYTQQTIVFVARRRILSGEEITIDYGPTYRL